jgi:hypothetical protein
MSQRVWDQLENLFEILVFGKNSSEDDNPTEGIVPVCPTQFTKVSAGSSLLTSNHLN